MSAEHNCKRQDRIDRSATERNIGYGPAIDYGPYLSEEDGWTIGNGEYGSRIWYCPFCGEELIPANPDERKT